MRVESGAIRLVEFSSRPIQVKHSLFRYGLSLLLEACCFFVLRTATVVRPRVGR